MNKWDAFLQACGQTGLQCSRRRSINDVWFTAMAKQTRCDRDCNLVSQSLFKTIERVDGFVEVHTKVKHLL